MRKKLCPGCLVDISGMDRHVFACRTCWFSVPADMRAEIWNLYRGARGSWAHMRAVGQVCRWLRDNPVSAR
jgi:hypothetical protein